MPVTDFFHGVRVFQRGETTRPIAVGDYSKLGAVVIAPNADQAFYPEDVAKTIFTNDAAALTKLGTGGNVDATIDAIIDQGIDAEIDIVRVPLGGGTGQAQIEATMANIVGSGSDFSGVHAFKQSSTPPKILFCAGYTSQRIANAKNPVMAEMKGVADRLRSIYIGETPSGTKEAAEIYRNDFPDDKRAYLFHPAVTVFRGGQSIVEAASGRVAGLFVKRDKELGGPWASPSNQTMGGITGPSRPIAYYNGQTDSEANWLNQRQITTLRRGHILWGNRTCAQDPLEAFVNVVRVLDMVDEAVVNNFMWAIDKTQSVPLGTAIVQSLDSFLDELVANGAILGGRVWFERPLNSNEALASGILKISFDREPAAPLEDLQFLAGRNLTYYATLADGILQSLERQAA